MIQDPRPLTSKDWEKALASAAGDVELAKEEWKKLKHAWKLARNAARAARNAEALDCRNAERLAAQDRWQQAQIEEKREMQRRVGVRLQITTMPSHLYSGLARETEQSRIEKSRAEIAPRQQLTQEQRTEAERQLAGWKERLGRLPEEQKQWVERWVELGTDNGFGPQWDRWLTEAEYRLGCSCGEDDSA